MSHGTHWFRQVLAFNFIQAACCCYSNGDFDCARKWYFWFGIFWGFIILLISLIAITNKLCKGNRVSCTSRSKGRRRNRAAAGRTNHPASITSSTQSANTQSTTITIISSNVAPKNAQAQNTQPQPPQGNVGVRPDSRQHQTTDIRNLNASETRPDTTSPVIAQPS